MSSPVAGVADDVLRIAVLGPMAFVSGENQWAGAVLARDEINGEGGISIHGKRLKIELIRVDTNEMLSVLDATSAMERAITRDKADVLVGGFRSEAVLAMQEIAMDHRKLFLGCGASDAKLGAKVEESYERYKYWFRNCTLSSAALTQTLYRVLDDIGARIHRNLNKERLRVAIVAEKATWTEAVTRSALVTLPKMKMDVVGVWRPSPFAADLTPELAAIDRAGIDLVLTALSGPVGVVLARQMGERHMKPIAFGINVEAQKDEFWQATAGKGNYATTLDTYAEVELTPATIPFVRAFKARFGKMPTYTAATYDVIKGLRAAIEKAATTDADKIVATIEKMTFVASGGIGEYDRAHDLVWGIGKSTGIAVQWQGGKRVPFWPPGVKGMQQFQLPSR